MIDKNLLIVVVIYFSGMTLLAQERVSITDFGGNPNDGKNTVISVRKALKACAGKDSSVLIFPKGRYDFWPDFTTSIETVGINIEKINHLTIDGEGSEFVFHGKMQIANIAGCENVTLKNFSVDWDHPFISQGQYVTCTNEYTDMKIDPEDYVIENGQFYLKGEGWKSKPTGYFILFDKDKKEILSKTHDGVNSSLIKGKSKEIKPGLIRFYGKPDIKPEPGTYQEFFSGTYITTGIQILESKNTNLKDITIYHALSHGIYGVRDENITVDNVNMTVNEKKGRVFSIVADASHFINCKGLIQIVNCKHTGQGDDFLNIHGTNTPISAIVDKYTVKTTKPAFTMRAGDEIWFDNKLTSQRGEVRIVKSVEPLGLADDKTMGSKIVFTDAIPESIKAGDNIENKTWNPRVEIRNCQILKRNRARGILVTTPEKVIIENNYFRTAGTAILIEGDTDYWFESGANEDVTIRNNVFEDCLTSGCENGKRGEWGEAIITITPSHHPENESTEPFHRNIKIIHNTFKTFDIPLVHARSVRGLMFNNNEVIKTYTYTPYAWQKSSFLLDGCREVTISGDILSAEYSTRLIEIEHMKKSDVKVDKNLKFTVNKIDSAIKSNYVDDFKAKNKTK